MGGRMLRLELADRTPVGRAKRRFMDVVIEGHEVSCRREEDEVGWRHMIGCGHP